MLFLRVVEVEKLGVLLKITLKIPENALSLVKVYEQFAFLCGRVEISEVFWSVWVKF